MRGVDPETLEFVQIQRISVLGPSGAGKSTLARRLGEILDLPVVHLDTIFWMPDWVQRPDEEFLHLVHQATMQDTWIIDGNYSRTIDERFKRVHLAIYLDFSRYRCLFRGAKRRIHYRGQTRPDLPDGCFEKFDFEFAAFTWGQPAKRAAMIAGLERLAEQVPVVVITRPRQVDQLLAIARAQAGVMSGIPA